MKRLVVVCALAILAIAAGPQPLVFGPWEPEQRQNPVEQQTQGGATQPDHSLWVVNNTQCAWDPDDSLSTGDLNGSLAPGATATGTKCIIADWAEHATYFDVNAPRSGLAVSLSFSPQNFTIQASRRVVSYGYDWWVCTYGPDYEPASPALEPIPNSGYGGVGVPTSVTVSVTNTTNRTISKINAFMRVSLTIEDASGGVCSFPLTHFHEGVYPGPFFSWETS